MSSRPSDAQLESWWAAHARASEDWIGRAGVVHVGLGAKERDDAVTDEVALLFYVEEKKPAGELRDDEMIPDAILGVKTDVQRFTEWSDEFGASNLDGGDAIRAVPDERDRPKPGTLGYIGTTTTGSENVMLSCDHVMIPRRRSDNRIFHPDVSRCCGKLKNAVGVATRGFTGSAAHTNSQGTQMYMVDCAIASIDSEVNGRKHIPGAGSVSGSGDISDDPTPITVVKRGAITGVTKGTVTDVDFDPHGPAGDMRLIRVRPLAGHTAPFEKDFNVPDDGTMEYCLTQYPLQSRGGTATQVGDNRVRFSLPAFTVPGDSGAVLVNDSSREIVGMIVSGDVFTFRSYNEEGRLGTGGMPAGDGWACHIQPVLGELDIRIDPSTEPSSMSTARLSPGDAIDADPPEPGKLELINTRLATLENVLETSEKGRLLNDLVRRHADELMNLVHHRRQVLVQWHRNKGPAFAALLLDALVEEDMPIPRLVNGVQCDTLLRRMRDVLAVEGSIALREAIRTHERFIFELLSESRTVNELVSRLK
jgi:hypothetical protein